MNSEKSEIDSTTDDTEQENATTDSADDTAATENSDATARADSDEPAKADLAKDADDSDDDTAVTGVAAKAQARAQARAASAETDGKQFTVSARALTRIGAAIVAVAVIAVCAFLGWKWYDTKQELKAFDDSRAASANYVNEYFGALLKEGASADQIKKTVGALSTGKQKEQIESAAGDMVTWRDTQKLANVTTKVNSTMVESFSKDHAVTLVSFEFTGTSAVAPSGGNAVTLLEVTLDKVDGDWLVSNIQAGPGTAGTTADAAQQTLPTAPETQPGPAPTQPAG